MSVSARHLIGVMHDTLRYPCYAVAVGVLVEEEVVEEALYYFKATANLM